ncbi:hypothetical protein [Thermomonospora curvata]|uniref:PE domain-containing protein n=1 Tax=Thermomonospora curvata (strain ATCC 19995 / DSM 43183 / JCM 3096 / KCTC 9072 / NBRC 15933 / NCIMB 10081 / Henssen B9) TaxID=471852 RepID=D1A4H5_THECD|nr:hypothetical protein [Thermomonospora curvata]ACY96210.1 hypothetical protein Tcur_0615 [Thermomonospora curvata DSM 43183]
MPPGEKPPPYLPSARSEEIQIAPGKLRDLATELEKDLDKLKKGHHAENIQEYSPKDYAFGDYDAGQSLYVSVRNGRDRISETFQTFIEAYEQLIESLRRSADNYERAEDANKRNVGGVGGGAYR